jgi:hypothetical protein
MTEKPKKELSQNIDEFVKSVEKETIKKVAKTAQAKLVIHISSLINELQSIIQDQSKGFERVISYLDAKSKEKDTIAEDIKESHKNILNAFKELVTNTQNIKVTNNSKNLTKKEVQYAFSGALDTIKNILIKNNDVPNSVSVGYNGLGKVSTITQNYGDYRLVTTIQYNFDGKVSSWKTNKI